jgi:hypothetical protein
LRHTFFFKEKSKRETTFSLPRSADMSKYLQATKCEAEQASGAPEVLEVGSGVRKGYGEWVRIKVECEAGRKPREG